MIAATGIAKTKQKLSLPKGKNLKVDACDVNRNIFLSENLSFSKIILLS